MDQEEPSKSPSFHKRQVQATTKERRGLLSDLGLSAAGPKGPDGIGLTIGAGSPSDLAPPILGPARPTGVPNPGPNNGPTPGGISFTPTPTSLPNPNIAPLSPLPGPTPTLLPLPGPSLGPNLDPNGSAVPTATAILSVSPGSNATVPPFPLPTGNVRVPVISTTAPTFRPTPTGPPSPPPPHKKPSGVENGTTAFASTTIKTIGIIVGVLGGVYLLWTIFRKLYFRPSKKFEHRLDDYDEDLFKPRPPSFAEKRQDHGYASSAIRSASSPQAEYQYGNGFHGTNSSPKSDGARMRSSYLPSGISHPSLKYGETHSYTSYNHSVEQDPHNFQGIFPLADMGPPPGSNSAPSSSDKDPEDLHNALQLPPPIFDSNSHRLPETGPSTRQGILR